MLELIGFVVVCWIAFSILRGVLRASSTIRSQEYGKETLHIATKELGVPEEYYFHTVTTSMDQIKEAATLLQEGDDFRQFSWPRLLGWGVYLSFRRDCEQWQQGNPHSENKFIELRITNETIVNELEKDPYSML